MKTSEAIIVPHLRNVDIRSVRRRTNEAGGPKPARRGACNVESYSNTVVEPS